MKITMNAGGEATQEDITALENKIGMPLAPSFHRFVKIHDGAEPAPHGFLISEEEGEDEIRAFIATRDIPATMERMDLPKGTYPVAYDSLGNYLIIDQSKGDAVFFWDHEIEDNLIKVANSFDEFLDMLKPDASDEDVDPSRLLSDWKSPDFDLQFAKYLIKETEEN